jgi:Fe-S-cluster-containing dehydrogenase component
MSKRVTRRTFLKAGLYTGAATAAGLLLPGSVMAASGSQLCTLFDLTKCIGCEACVEACRDINATKFPVLEKPMPVMYPTDRVKIADWSSIEKQAVQDRLTPYNWLYVQTARGSHEGREFELNIPRRCMHCHNAPCVNLCPFGAAFAQNNGIVRIHPQVCMGGAKCKAACPWKIPERQSGVGSYMNLLPNYAGNGVMYKCDRCYDRVAQGELPACIEACPKEVQTIGPRKEIIERARWLADEMNGFIYGEKENGGTNTLYVSPIPFDVLDASIKTAAGRPHLNGVTAAMASTNNLATALVAGPIIGAMAAVLQRKRAGGSPPDQKE